MLRRHFLTKSVGTSLCLSLPALARQGARGSLKFGIITDIHQDVMHDGLARVTAFIQAMQAEKVDFIVQLGDFCVPHERNRAFLTAWNQFKGPRHHVLGNHDTDGGFKREDTVAYLGMPARYYAFDHNGIRFIALDGNDPGGTAKGYPRHISKDQLDWLEKQLAATALPVVVMIHQPLEGSDGIDNQNAVRTVLEQPRGDAHPGVAAVLTGHLHQDYVRRINDIAHIQFNSASYVWLPGGDRRQVYDQGTHQTHPHLDRVAPYREPLWAVATLDHDTATLTIKGRATTWVGPDPWTRGATEADYPRNRTRPAISNWSGKLTLS